MQKKEYQSPKMKIVKLMMHPMLLPDSPGGPSSARKRSSFSDDSDSRSSE